jgi:DNA-binding transcriptional ArsR family regulator
MAQVTKSEDPGAHAQAEGGTGGDCACCGATLSELLPPQLFKALADPKRLSLLARLAEERRPRTVSQMAEGSGVDLSVVSRHLAVLREAGVIKCVKQGKEVWCSVQPGAVVRLLRDLADALESCCSGSSDSSPAKPPSASM